MDSWNCRACTYRNSASSTTCEICSAPNDDAEMSRSCPVCTYANSLSASECEICATALSSQPAAPPSGSLSRENMGSPPQTFASILATSPVTTLKSSDVVFKSNAPRPLNPPLAAASNQHSVIPSDAYVDDSARSPGMDRTYDMDDWAGFNFGGDDADADSEPLPDRAPNSDGENVDNDSDLEVLSVSQAPRASVPPLRNMPPPASPRESVLPSARPQPEAVPAPSESSGPSPKVVPAHEMASPLPRPSPSQGLAARILSVDRRRGAARSRVEEAAAAGPGAKKELSAARREVEKLDKSAAELVRLQARAAARRQREEDDYTASRAVRDRARQPLSKREVTAARASGRAVARIPNGKRGEEEVLCVVAEAVPEQLRGALLEALAVPRPGAAPADGSAPYINAGSDDVANSGVPMKHCVLPLPLPVILWLRAPYPALAAVAPGALAGPEVIPPIASLAPFLPARLQHLYDEPCPVTAAVPLRSPAAGPVLAAGTPTATSPGVVCVLPSLALCRLCAPSAVGLDLTAQLGALADTVLQAFPCSTVVLVVEGLAAALARKAKVRRAQITAATTTSLAAPASCICGSCARVEAAGSASSLSAEWVTSLLNTPASLFKSAAERNRWQECLAARLPFADVAQAKTELTAVWATRRRLCLRYTENLVHTVQVVAKIAKVQSTEFFRAAESLVSVASVHASAALKQGGDSEARRAWLRMLMELPGITEARAREIVKCVPSARSLYELVYSGTALPGVDETSVIKNMRFTAGESASRTDDADSEHPPVPEDLLPLLNRAMGILQNVPVSAGGRRLGPALARQMVVAFTIPHV